MLLAMKLNFSLALLMLCCIFHTTRGHDDTVQQLVSRIEALEKKVDNQRHFQDGLQHELRETKEKVRQQDELIEILMNELQRTKLDIAEREQRIILLEQEVEMLLSAASGNVRQRPVTNENSGMNERSQLIRDKSVKRNTRGTQRAQRIRPTRFVGQPVAFHAMAKQTQTHIGIHQSILFETVLTNIGTVFHVNHGTFIAPTHGIYIFSVSAPSAGEAAHLVIATELVKDGSVLGKTYSKSDTGYIDQGSVTVATELQSGNEVWVRLNHPADTSMASSYSSFTGVLLYEYEV